MREELSSEVLTLDVTSVVVSSPARFQTYKAKRKQAKLSNKIWLNKRKKEKNV
jgi:hypothetical protein